MGLKKLKDMIAERRLRWRARVTDAEDQHNSPPGYPLKVRFRRILRKRSTKKKLARRHQVRPRGHEANAARCGGKLGADEQMASTGGPVRLWRWLNIDLTSNVIWLKYGLQRQCQCQCQCQCRIRCYTLCKCQRQMTLSLQLSTLSPPTKSYQRKA